MFFIVICCFFNPAVVLHLGDLLTLVLLLYLSHWKPNGPSVSVVYLEVAFNEISREL